MNYLNFLNIGIALASFFVGSLGASFIAKFFFRNYIKRNDTKHDEWRKSIEDIKIALVGITSKVDLIREIRDDLKSHNAYISMLNTRLQRVEGEAFYQTRR